MPYRPLIHALLLVALLSLPLASAAPGRAAPAGPATRIILMIADGWGANHLAATNRYTGATPEYQQWPRHWVATYPAGGGYDPTEAWRSFTYVLLNPTDSAAAATALATGQKTANGRISTTSDGSTRLLTLAEAARGQSKAVGAVSTVPLSHATPGGWLAHNESRANGFAIADEELFGDPNSTGSPTESHYAGGRGPTLPPADVVIGAGHPAWTGGGNYVNMRIRDRLAAESGQPGKPLFVERIAGRGDGGARLLAAATMPTVTQLVGLFHHEYRLADLSATSIENATLAEMARAALLVLDRNPGGFVLMIEGGAVDWGAHANRMSQVIGEQRDFDAAVQAVIDWVEDPTTTSDWSNTLLIVTGDHETGYLTAAPGHFPDEPLGEVSPRTLALEKSVVGSGGRRASWEDSDSDGAIDPTETVYWAWNSGGHANTLIPLYARGPGAASLESHATATDPVRGPYLDNTAIFTVMESAMIGVPTAITTPTIRSGPRTLWRHPSLVVGLIALGLALLARRHRGG